MEKLDDKKLVFRLLFAVLGLCFLQAHAQAGPRYAFNCAGASESIGTGSQVGETQLFVDLEPFGNNQVVFAFSNLGSEDCSVTDIYFRDGSLLGIASIIDADAEPGYAGVNFREGADPDHLADAGRKWKISAGFIADSAGHGIENGIGPGESLGIAFDLRPGKSLQNLVNEIASSKVQISLHAQGPSLIQGQESYINGPEPISAHVPAPGAVLLGAVGVGLVGWLRKRKTL